MSQSFEIMSESVEQTREIGQRLGERLLPGDVVGLVGELGAGKTHLAKGIALGLGVSDESLVSSPTFVLIHEYAGRLPVFHIDAYRLKNSGQLEELGFDELCGGEGVVIVEWADRVKAAMPGHTLWVEISSCGETSRELTCRSENRSLVERLN